MVHHLGGEDPPRIDPALNPVRAAIDMVANGAATRITVHTMVGDQILPAARLLARAAGVTLEPTWRAGDAGWDLVVTPPRRRKWLS